nr:immunoglobulin light chain junction region [Macaca mulatta]
CYQYFSGYSY